MNSMNELGLRAEKQADIDKQIFGDEKDKSSCRFKQNVIQYVVGVGNRGPERRSTPDITDSLGRSSLIPRS